MNKAQKTILLCGMVALVIMVLFPPWLHITLLFTDFVGYGPLWSPPQLKGKVTPANTVAISHLLAQIIALVGVTGVLYAVMK